MKKKISYICLGLILILIISVGLMYPKQTKEELKNDTNELISYYIEKENNVYEQTTRRNWLTEGYVLNEVKSNCENDSVLTWVNNKVQITGNVSDKCYIYFDKIVKDYPYTENIQETGESYKFIAPVSGIYKIELWGAQGGGAYYDYENGDETVGYGRIGEYIKGGKGGYVSGNINLEKNTILYIYVGGMGNDYSSTTSFHDRATGGFNGGGQGGWHYQVAGSGGGATDIRLQDGNWNNFNSLKSRIMVAGAGAGTSNYRNAVSGGYGGGLIGGLGNLNINSVGHQLATGGTQTFGGKCGAYDQYYSDTELFFGKFGIGGDSQHAHGSGGGSGYYGGGGGNFVQAGVSSGAGGSSFISGHLGCLAIDESSLEDDIKLKNGCTEDSKTIECATHYSNYKFENTEMIDGLGYKWTTEAGEQTGMPSPRGETEMGHTGNGYARITYLGE